MDVNRITGQFSSHNYKTNGRKSAQSELMLPFYRGFLVSKKIDQKLQQLLQKSIVWSSCTCQTHLMFRIRACCGQRSCFTKRGIKLRNVDVHQSLFKLPYWMTFLCVFLYTIFG